MKKKSSWRFLHCGISLSQGSRNLCIGMMLLMFFSLHVSAKSNDLHPAETSAVYANAINQQKKLTGKVVDESGQPIPGVSILVKGTDQGTITNVDGIYEIANLNEEAVLVFSFVGFVNQEVVVSNQSTLNITLVEDVQGLDEVVVVGYGTQKKTEVTSSVAKVSAADFNQGFAANPLQAVEGKVAGLQIVRPAGNDPNGSFNIRLRGQGTLKAGASPLIVIDGVSGGDLNTVAPEDIESINVLKDGSAAAIYGTRGSNGVILITTKGGKEGILQVEYSGYVSTERAYNVPDMMNAQQYLEMGALLKADDPNKSFTDLGADEDYLNGLIAKPFSQVHNLSFSGGTEKLSYRASVNYRDMEGIMINSGKESLNARIGVTHTGYDGRLMINTIISTTFDEGNYADKKYDGTGNDYRDTEMATRINPTRPIIDEDGMYTKPTGFRAYNPIAKREQESKSGLGRKVVASLRGTYELIDGLTVGAFGAYHFKSVYDRNYQEIVSPTSIAEVRDGNAFQYHSDDTKKMYDLTLDYKKVLGDVHSLGVLLGHTYEYHEFSSFNASNSNFLTDDLGAYGLAAGSYLLDGKATMGSYRDSDRLSAFFGRLTYAYAGKYLFSATVRHEGSSRFGANNKWATFPAASVGWRITEESFMDDVRVVNNLKLRVGFGVTGNIIQSNYLSREALEFDNSFIDYAGNKIPVYSSTYNANPDLGWETKSEINAGIDFGVLNNRITGSFDYYHRTTSDMLWNLSVPVPPNKFSKTWTNVGEMTNQGIELGLQNSIIRTGDLSVSLDVTFSFNKNELVNLDNDVNELNFVDYGGLSEVGGVGSIYRHTAGQPIGSFYGYKFSRLDENGKWLFVTADGGEANLDDIEQDDKVSLGNGNPEYNFSFTPRVNYKGLDFSMNFRGAAGFDIVNEKNVYLNNPHFYPSNLLTSAIDSPLRDRPAFSDYYLEKGDYLKIDNITLGYTLPEEFRVGFSHMRLYATVQNLHTFTGYSGIDPEVQIGTNGGHDGWGFYPRSTTYTFGLNVKF